MKKKILLKAPVLTTSGYGHHARTVLRALREYEDYFDVYLEALNWGRCGWLWEDTEERKYIDSLMVKTLQYKQMNNGQCPVDIFCHVTIPNEFEQKAPVNIGITAGIETTKISPQWVEKSQLVNKMIVVSNHAKYGFDNSFYDAHGPNGETIKDFKCQVPISVIPYPVLKVEPVSIDLQLETDFNFLLVAQWSVRKNVEKVISWFIEENFGRSNVGLVCKMNISANSKIDRYYMDKRVKMLLSKYPDRKCKIYIVHGDMTDAEMAGLYTHSNIKALISLGPECFGLPMFEAAYYGLPIITFAWGGQNDFLFMPMKSNKGKISEKPMFSSVEFELKPIPKEAIWDGVLIPEGMWAYPKEGSFKTCLRNVYSNYQKYKQQATWLQKHVEKKFSAKKIYKQYAEEILGQKINKVEMKDLPKVSIISSVFNGMEHLEKCLEDVKRQSIFKEKCEHIIVHPKNSPTFEEEKEIIDQYVKENENVKYIVLEEDPGLYGCWNTGIHQSCGEYLTNWNIDDRRRVDCIEKCSKELLSSGDVDCVYYDQLITDKSNETFEKNSSEGRKYNFPEYTFEYQKMMNCVFHAMSVWKKSMHEKYGMFNPMYKSAGDWEFSLRAGSKGAKFKKMPDILGLYLFNPVGISTNPANFDWKREEEQEIYEAYKDIKLT